MEYRHHPRSGQENTGICRPARMKAAGLPFARVKAVVELKTVPVGEPSVPPVRDGMATLNPLAAQIIGQLSSLEI